MPKPGAGRYFFPRPFFELAIFAALVFEYPLSRNRSYTFGRLIDRIFFPGIVITPVTNEYPGRSLAEPGALLQLAQQHLHRQARGDAQ